MENLQQLISCLFDTRHLMLVLADSEGVIKKTNAAFNQFFCRQGQPDELVGQSLYDLWSGSTHDLQDAMRCLAKDRTAIFTQQLTGFGESKKFEIELRKVDGAFVLFELKDIEEVESSKIAEARARLDATQQRKNVQELAAVVSHDLRAPVANMAYLMSLFRKNDISHEEFKPFMEALQVSAHRTLEAIDGLGGKLNYDLSKKNAAGHQLSELIDTVLLKHQEEILKADAQVRVHASQLNLFWPHEEAFKMILSQIISNSLKFARPGVRPEIEINGRLRGDNCIIQVKDNGIGIDLEGRRERLFGLFQTFHNRPDERGIGLYQVKNRLKALGGEIKLESTKGEGTLVTLILKVNEFKETSLHCG